MYAFLLDRRSLALLTAGALLAGGLLFFSGFLLGLRANLPPESTAGGVAVFQPLSKRWEAVEGTALDAVSAAEEAAKKVTSAAEEEAKKLKQQLEVSSGRTGAVDPAASELPAPAGSQVSTESLAQPVAGVSGNTHSGFGEPGPSSVPPVAAASFSVATPIAPRDVTNAPPRPPSAQTTPAHTASTRPEQPTDTPGIVTTFSLQVGAFSTHGNAREMQEDLVRRGYVAYLIPIELNSGRILISVRVGRYADKAEALAAAKAFRAAEQRDALVRWRDEVLAESGSSGRNLS